MKVLVAKDKFSLKYKIEGMTCSTWKSLPNTVKTADDIIKHFAEGRHQPIARKFDPPTLSFVDENLRPVVYFNVSKDKRHAVEDFDPKKKVRFHTPDFAATDLELHDFLRDRCRFDLEREIIELDSLEEKNNLMLKNASAETLAELHQTFLTEDSISSHLRSHAKQYHNAAVNINFTE